MCLCGVSDLLCSFGQRGSHALAISQLFLRIAIDIVRIWLVLSSFLFS